MSTESFLRLRFVGMRFDDHAIPLELLKNLAVLEEMVVDVAKWRFLREHPGRRRSPRGFTQGIQLKLTTIDEGSAVLNIGLALDQSSQSLLFPPIFRKRLEGARDTIIGVVGGATREQSTEQDLPGRLLDYLDRIGRGLKDGEAVEFANPDGRISATLTRDFQTRLVHSLSGAKEFTGKRTVRGVVPEADQDEMTFDIQLFDGRRVKAPIEPQHLDTVRQVFNGYRDGLRAVFQGVGRLSHSNQLLGFRSIEEVTVLDALDIGAQLDDLRTIQDGWLEGGGQAPPGPGLDWLSAVFDQHFSEVAPLPYLYPTETGGVQAEWSLGPNEVTLEIDLTTHKAEWHVLSIDTNDVSERTLNCDDANDWKWLVDRLDGMDRHNG